VTTPLEFNRFYRDHINQDVPLARRFFEVFDYAESLQIEQQARSAAEQDARHWRERCEDLAEALQPLAALGKHIGDRYEDRDLIAQCGTLAGPVRLRVRDARRAAQILESEPQ
jgi:hypothetical protein